MAKKAWEFMKAHKKKIAAAVAFAAAAVGDGASGWQVVKAVAQAFGN